MQDLRQITYGRSDGPQGTRTLGEDGYSSIFIGRFGHIAFMEPANQTSVCEHLMAVDDYLRGQGVRVAAVCRPWSRNCRTWVVYENVVLDAEGLRGKFDLPEFVIVHSHRGTHDGSEHGLVCERCHDALIGLHPAVSAGVRVVG